MLAKRIIPCLSVANGRVQNGVQFRDMVDAGDPAKCAEEAVGRGAGELLVTSIDRHGTGLGFDIELYQALAEVVDVPVIVFGGAGNMQHFVDLFTKTNVTGALVGALLHNKVLTIKDIKKALHEVGVVVRQ